MADEEEEEEEDAACTSCPSLNALLGQSCCCSHRYLLRYYRCYSGALELPARLREAFHGVTRREATPGARS
ncbi:unnamed protein product [Merluccius merluccius]